MVKYLFVIFYFCVVMFLMNANKTEVDHQLISTDDV